MTKLCSEPKGITLFHPAEVIYVFLKHKRLEVMEGPKDKAGRDEDTAALCNQTAKVRNGCDERRNSKP